MAGFSPEFAMRNTLTRGRTPLVHFKIFFQNPLSNMKFSTNRPSQVFTNWLDCDSLFSFKHPKVKWEVAKRVLTGHKIYSFSIFLQKGNKINSWIGIDCDFHDGVVFSSKNLSILNQCSGLHKVSSITFVSFALTILQLPFNLLHYQL